jgi:hypothetical protein
MAASYEGLGFGLLAGDPEGALALEPDLDGVAKADVLVVCFGFEALEF